MKVALSSEGVAGNEREGAKSSNVNRELERRVSSACQKQRAGVHQK